MLGEKIKKYRESKNMTQGEIADILGVKAATISKYEAETLEPNIESLKRLADLFEVSVDELIKEDSFDISKINILEVLKEVIKPGDVVLLKASNGMKFYELAERMISLWKKKD